MSDDLLLALHGVSYAYRDRVAVEGVDLEIPRRGLMAVIGPNGGGKTTLLKLMLGLLPPSSGRVERHHDTRGGALGYVPQFASFDESFPIRVREVVRMGLLGRRGPFRRYRREDLARVDGMLRRFRLDGLATAPIGGLSGGQLQRTLIARALLGDPEALFLDEPLASIDAEMRRVLVEELAVLATRIPVVVVTHDLTPFAGLVDEIACVNRRLHHHPEGRLTPAMLEEVYGCPVELVTHGVPHRVLADHGGHGHG